MASRNVWLTKFLRMKRNKHDLRSSINRLNPLVNGSLTWSLQSNCPENRSCFMQPHSVLKVFPIYIFAFNHPFTMFCSSLQFNIVKALIVI